MVFLGLLGLLGVVYLLLLPVLSFVRTLQLGRDLKELRRRLDLIEQRLHDAGPLPERASPARPLAPSPAPPPPVFVSPRLPEWSRRTTESSPPNVDPNVPNDPNIPNIPTVPNDANESLEERI